MSEERKNEDFVGMLKKMKTNMKSPSVIGDALDKLEILQKENEHLKEQLNKSINLIHSSEKVLQKALDEKERLKEDGRIAMEKLGEDIIDLKNQNSDLQNLLLGKNEEFQQKEKEISGLKTIAETVSKELEAKKKGIPQTDSAISQALVEDLSSELSKRRVQISNYENQIKTLEAQIEGFTQDLNMYKSKGEIIAQPQEISPELAKKDIYIYELEERIRNLEQHIAELAEENANLNKKITEQQSAWAVDYVVPVVEATTTAKKPEPAPTSVSTLEKLCQDLQSDLNRYKKILDSLKVENKELKKTLEAGGVSTDFEEINDLRNENISLKARIINFEKTMEEQTLEVSLSLDSENKIKELQNQLNEKAILINELKTSQIILPVAQSGPMSNLVEDLQAKINKMKTALNEKDKTIEDLKSKG
jgi:chromosome segregation ATPase